jgi:hypothetical protein
LFITGTFHGKHQEITPRIKAQTHFLEASKMRELLKDSFIISLRDCEQKFDE